MTENDYIAEYVKERRPDVLGADFALWKFGKILRELCETLGGAIVEAINNMPLEEIKKITEELESEEQV